MSADRIIIGLMAVFALLGALDRIFGNRLGLGKEFEEGILAMGSLAMAMLGIISLAPVLAAVLKPIVVPVFSLLGVFSISNSFLSIICFILLSNSTSLSF